MKVGENTATLLGVFLWALEMSRSRWEQFSGVVKKAAVETGIPQRSLEFLWGSQGLSFGHCPLIFYTVSVGNFLHKLQFSFCPRADAMV